MTPDLVEGCLPCERQARWGDLPVREQIHTSEHWRVTQAFNSTLEGWLVVLPTRHVTGLADVPLDASRELDELLVSLSQALVGMTSCERTYVMQFSEADGFAHLHLHVVPRPPDLPPQRRGPAVFGFLSDDPGRWISEARLNEVSDRIRRRLGELGTP